MEDILDLNSDILKRKIKKDLSLYENTIIQSNILNDIQIYVLFLYYDILPKDILKTLQAGEPDSYIPLIRNPEGQFELLFESIIDKFKTNDNDQLPEIKSRISNTLGGKYTEIQKKVSECEKHIKILEELYIQKEIEQYVPFTSGQKEGFIINNKSVLIQPASNDYRFSELFSRYLFAVNKLDLEKSVIDENKLKNQIEINTFYNRKLFESMIIPGKDCSDNINSFSDWNYMLKFWFVYILVIKEFFANNSDFQSILTRKNIYEKAKKLREIKKTKSDDKKGLTKEEKILKKKLFSSLRGGDNGEGNLNKLKKELVGDKKEDKKPSNPFNKSDKSNKEKGIKLYSDLMKDILIFKKSKNKNTTEIISFNEFINGDELKNFIQKEYKKCFADFTSSKSTDNKSMKIGTKIKLIFDKDERDSDISLESLGFKKKNTENIPEDKIIKLLDEKITIFQSLYTYRTVNDSEFNNFFTALKKNLISLYFVLYYKKLFIYKQYINVFKRYQSKLELDLNEYSYVEENESSNKNNKKNIQNKNQMNIKQNNTNQRTIDLNRLSPNKRNIYIDLTNKIKYLKNTKNKLEKNKNDSDYDKKILIIEKKIRELLIQKHNLYGRLN